MKNFLWKHKGIIVIFLLVIFFLCRNVVIHRFSTERWKRLPEKRVEMVDNLLEKYELVGMTHEEVMALLGKDTNTQYFKTESNIVYYLGPERGLIRIDSEWLVLDFQEDRVSEVNIRRD